MKAGFKMRKTLATYVLLLEYKDDETVAYKSVYENIMEKTKLNN